MGLNAGRPWPGLLRSWAVDGPQRQRFGAPLYSGQGRKARSRALGRLRATYSVNNYPCASTAGLSIRLLLIHDEIPYNTTDREVLPAMGAMGATG